MAAASVRTLGLAIAVVTVSSLCRLLGSDLPGARAEPEVPPSWDFVVSIPDLARGLAEVSWTVRGFGGTRPLRVCADMDGGEKSVVRIERADTKKLLPRDGDCWLVPDPEPRGVVLRYTYDLRGLASQNDSPDYAERVGRDTYIFNDEAVLLRPDPMPRRPGTPGPTIRVELKLPPGAQVAAPWDRVPGPGWNFVLDAAQYDGGSYVIVGTIEDLGELKLPHTTVQVVTLPGSHRLSAAALRSWTRRAMTAVDSFYGALTPPRVLVNLVPIAGQSDAALFGTVLRPQHPSVVIYYGSDCERAETPQEWVAVHELFHMGNPLLNRKIHWFTEGFTTYYQNILRARAGTITAAAAWGDMWDGFRRFCQPDGTSLKDESERLRSTYRYTRVYWGGACLAFLADVGIRENSRGKQSLDDILRGLRERSLRAPLDEDEIIDALDEAAGNKLVSGLLRERRGIAVRERLQRLGIEIAGPDSVRLRDDAPLSVLRKSMF